MSAFGDSRVDLIEVLLWCSNSAAITLENCVQSLACKSRLCDCSSTKVEVERRETTEIEVSWCCLLFVVELDSGEGHSKAEGL